MKISGKKSTTSSLDDDLRKLEERRAVLEQRCSALREHAAEARQAAFNHLIAGDLDDAAEHQRLDAAAAAAQAPVDSLAAALGEIDELIDTTRAKIAAEAAAAERRRRAEEAEREAKRLEAQAGEIVARIKALDAAAAALASEFDELVAALPADFCIPMMRRNPNDLGSANLAAAPDLARAIVASSLASRSPAIFEPIEPIADLAAPAYERRALLLQHIDDPDGRLQYTLIESADPTSLPARVEAAIVDNLRSRAAELRAEVAEPQAEEAA